MSTKIGSFVVRNNDTGKECSIDIIEDPDDEAIVFVEQQWSPLLQDQKARAILSVRALPPEKRSLESFRSILAKVGAQDAHWNWRFKRERMIAGVHRMYVMLDGESVEALMRVNLSAYSQLATTGLKEIVYVDYVAVAPWNRAALGKRRYEGLGRIMLGVAVSLSLEEGMEGRCGLHSLPQAEGFYLKVGMTDAGLVDNEGLKYFEFESAAAENYLKVRE